MINIAEQIIADIAKEKAKYRMASAQQRISELESAQKAAAEMRMRMFVVTSKLKQVELLLTVSGSSWGVR